MTSDDNGKKKNQDKNIKMTFESELERLSLIVTQLEKGELSLEDSLKLFEEGVGISRSAQGKLDHAQKRIEELLAVDADGTAKVKPFLEV